MAKQVTIFNTTGGGMVQLAKVDVNPMTGVWPSNGKPFAAASGVKSILVKSGENGQASAANYITEIGQGSGEQQSAPAREERPNELELFLPIERPIAKQIQADAVRNEQGVATAFQWMVPDSQGNLTPLENNGVIKLSPGDTVVISVKDGNHGLVFPNGDQAKDVFEFRMPGVAFETKPDFGKTAIGTDGVGAPSVLATLTVKKGVSRGTKVKLFCAAHNHKMAATFVIE
jgi:hypothetical protein